MRGWIIGAAVAAGTFVAACTPETTCEYLDPIPPTGNLARDIQGCWQGIGLADIYQDPAFLVAYDFNGVETGSAEPFWREIQSANRIHPSGQVFEYGYTVLDGGAVTLDGGTVVTRGGVDLTFGGAQDIPTLAAVEVNPTSLRLQFQYSNGYAEQVLRRAVCTGFGFEQEDPAVACATAGQPAVRSGPWAP